MIFRFDGLAIVKIKIGLSLSQSLKELILSRNPISPEDAEILLTGVKNCETLENLDLDEIWVNKSFNEVNYQVFVRSCFHFLWQNIIFNFKLRAS